MILNESICPHCDFMIYGKDNNERGYKKCGQEAVKYRRKNGKRFDIIEDGRIKKESRKIVRLCEEHADEYRRAGCDIVEAENEYAYE